MLSFIAKKICSVFLFFLIYFSLFQVVGAYSQPAAAPLVKQNSHIATSQFFRKILLLSITKEFVSRYEYFRNIPLAAEKRENLFHDLEFQAYQALLATYSNCLNRELSFSKKHIKLLKNFFSEHPFRDVIFKKHGLYLLTDNCHLTAKGSASKTSNTISLQVKRLIEKAFQNVLHIFKTSEKKRAIWQELLAILRVKPAGPGQERKKIYDKSDLYAFELLRQGAYPQLLEQLFSQISKRPNLRLIYKKVQNIYAFEQKSSGTVMLGEP